jgi:hypothetical protein
MNALREKAATAGADFVSLLSMTEPPREKKNCRDGRFILRGIGYKLAAPGEQTASTSNSSIPSAPAAPAVSTASTATCDPPCSPGYKCSGRSNSPRRKQPYGALAFTVRGSAAFRCRSRRRNREPPKDFSLIGNHFSQNK